VSIWGRPTFQTYYQSIDRIVNKEFLDKESPDDLLRVDFEQYLDYLVSKCEWQPLEWDESQMTVERFTTIVERPGGWEPQRTYRTELQQFRLRIPVSPHPQRDDYLKLLPSVYGLSELEWNFQGNTMVIEVDATEAAVKRALEEVRTSFGRRNKDIEEGNRTLRERIRPVWEARRRRLEHQYKAANDELSKLNIPLYRETDARAKPVEIKPRELRTVIRKPTPAAKSEPYLRREDAVGLVDFIEQYARQFEITPKTYSKMDEEEVRDLIIGMMNTNYRGAATAETFNKLGKTDIRLWVDAGNVLICECQVWNGSKAYSEAITQLFGYLTWRESYGVLITFCKRRDMTAAIAQAKKAAETHGSYASGSLTTSSASRFSTRHKHPQDSAKSLEIYHLFIDLSV
jgi:hypothetical protein